jgi:hypothetical protein
MNGGFFPAHHPCWHPSGMRNGIAFGPVVSLVPRSTTGYPI